MKSKLYTVIKDNDRVKVFQDKALGTTVVKYIGCKEDAYHKICKTLYANAGPNPRYTHATMPNEITAIVHLNREDNWDSATGIREAYKKADRKHNREFKSAIKRWMIWELERILAVDSDLFVESLNQLNDKYHFNN